MFSINISTGDLHFSEVEEKNSLLEEVESFDVEVLSVEISTSISEPPSPNVTIT